jgi:hypothetical protein
MANANREEIVTPVGRLVQGSVYTASTKDGEGKPLVYKSGDNVGQPRKNYYMALAVPKGAEAHWSATPWGAKIVAVARKAFSEAQIALPSFAWKITDGDSLIPNGKGTVPAKCEGFAGCWIIKFSGSHAPTLLKLNSLGKTEPFLTENAIMPGMYVQISGNVVDNESQQKPGVHINHGMVCYRAHGDLIFTGVDPDSVGFGEAPLPAGVTVVPTNSAFPATPTPVPPPHTAILAPPPPPAPVAPQRVMTQRATASYQEYVNLGWTDLQLVQQGYMQP